VSPSVNAGSRPRSSSRRGGAIASSRRRRACSSIEIPCRATARARSGTGGNRSVPRSVVHPCRAASWSRRSPLGECQEPAASSNGRRRRDRRSPSPSRARPRVRDPKSAAVARQRSWHRRRSGSSRIRTPPLILGAGRVSVAAPRAGLVHLDHRVDGGGRRFESVRGLRESPANGPVVLPGWARIACAGTRRVHVPGLAGMRGHGRRLAAPCDTAHRRDKAARSRESPCTRAPAVALLGRSLTPPCREGVTGAWFSA
jgi:hypothetical protein